MTRLTLLAALLVGAGLLTTAHAAPLSKCAEGVSPVIGTPAGEKLVGGPECQWILGRGGDDRIWAGEDSDTLRGGPGDDTLHAEDSYDVGVWESDRTDVLDGGSGWDTCIVSPHDVFTNCETVIQR